MIEPEKCQSGGRSLMASADDWHAFRTSWGWMASAWQEEQLFAFTFGHRRKTDALQRLGGTSGQCAVTEAAVLEKSLRRYLSGNLAELDDVSVDIRDCTPFQQSVLQACRRIPCGEVRTYAELAVSSGHPGAARAVGNVMRRNRHPLIIPCHRVVGSSGKLVAYSAPGGLERKRELLTRERLFAEQASTCQQKGKH